MGGGPPDFPPGSSCLVVLWILLCQLVFHVLDFHRLWSCFPACSTRLIESRPQSLTPDVFLLPVWALSLSLAATYEIDFFFLLLRVLRCFSSPRFPPHTLCIHVWVPRLLPLGVFPHSDSHGSIRICQSPWIFAAYRVLLRLSVPRHSPYALRSLTSWFNFRFYLSFRFLFSVFLYYYFFLASRL